jgi:3-hydroxyisobutyrate dehydrogenase-like beta-hydroxyacid dehydrogenase
MPRSKPTQVTEHRITFGTWERKQAEQLKAGIIGGTVMAGAGILAVGVGGTYVAYKIGKAILDWGEDIVDTGKTVVARTTKVLAKSPDIVEGSRYGRIAKRWYDQYDNLPFI